MVTDGTTGGTAGGPVYQSSEVGECEIRGKMVPSPSLSPGEEDRIGVTLWGNPKVGRTIAENTRCRVTCNVTVPHEVTAF